MSYDQHTLTEHNMQKLYAIMSDDMNLLPSFIAGVRNKLATLEKLHELYQNHPSNIIRDNSRKALIEISKDSNSLRKGIAKGTENDQ